MSVLLYHQHLAEVHIKDVCTIDNKEVRNKTHIYLEKYLWKTGAEMDQMPFSRLRLFELNFYKAKTKIQSFRFRFVKVETQKCELNCRSRIPWRQYLKN